MSEDIGSDSAAYDEFIENHLRYRATRVDSFPKIPNEFVWSPGSNIPLTSILPVALASMVVRRFGGPLRAVGTLGLVGALGLAAYKLIGKLFRVDKAITLEPGPVDVIDGKDGRNTTHQLQDLKIEPIVVQEVKIRYEWELPVFKKRIPYYILRSREEVRKINVHKFVHSLNASVRACTADSSESIKRLSSFMASDNQVNYDSYDILRGENHLSDTQYVAVLVNRSFYRSA